MGPSADAIRDQYEVRDLTQRILATLTQRGLDVDELAESELAELGEFHTAGRAMTEELAQEAEIRAGDRVLDVGAGIGGPARYLASTRGCSVVALDIVPEFCAAAVELCRRTGLDHLVDVVTGNATDLRFGDGEFDVVWTQHTAMNVEDKHALYTEFRRMVRPGGRLAMFDVVAGDGRPLHLPVPWASAPGQSFLESSDVVEKLLVATGWEPKVWRDPTEQIADALGRASGAGLGDLLMRDPVAMRSSYRRNLSENRARLLLAVCVAV